MRGAVAILCSGQGTQHAGMFDLVSQAPEAQTVLETAREMLGGVEPARFVREADERTLFSNRVGQTCAARRRWRPGRSFAPTCLDRWCSLDTVSANWRRGVAPAG